MVEKLAFQPEPEASDKEAWLKELGSKKTRDLILGHILLKMRLSKEDAEDITQQVMFRATKAIENGQFRGESKLTSWLYTITKNEALNFLRKRNRHPLPVSLDADTGFSDYKGDPARLKVEEKIPNNEPTSEEKYVSAEENKNLRSSFDKLPPRQKEMMQLLADGLTNKEVAERMGINIGTVKSQTFKASKLLRESEEKKDGE